MTLCHRRRRRGADRKRRGTMEEGGRPLWEGLQDLDCIDGSVSLLFSRSEFYLQLSQVGKVVEEVAVDGGQFVVAKISGKKRRKGGGWYVKN